LLGLLDALLDRRGDLLRLPVTDADTSGSIAHDHERGEREPPAALDDLRHAVDRDHALLVGRAFRRAVVSPHQISKPSSRAPSARARTRPWYRCPPRSNTARETPAAFARCASAFPTA